MRAGSIKKGGKVRHLWDVYDNLSYRRCGGDQWEDTNKIDFDSNAPACKACVSVERMKIRDAKRNLAKLGVK